MSRRCARCGEGDLHPRTGVCDVCEIYTRWWIARDTFPVLNAVRWALFKRMSSLARHGLELSLQDLDLASFELVFRSFGTAQAEDTVQDDSDEEEEAVVKKKLVLNGFSQVRCVADSVDSGAC